MGQIALISPPQAKMRHSGRSITVHASEGVEKAINANGNDFMSLNLKLRFDLNPDSIKHIWGNSARGRLCGCVGRRLSVGG